MEVINQTRTVLECCNENKTFYASARWDGCCDIRRYYNGYKYGDEDIPEGEIDYIHICELRKFINFLTEIADRAEQIGFEDYGE